VLTDDERQAVQQAGELFAMAMTPYYATLIDPEDPEDPIRKQAVPCLAELHVRQSEVEDPLAEDTYMPVPGLTHRYPDRVMLYTTHNCPVYCRHCNRKRKVGDPETAAPKQQLAACVEYIRKTPAVRDVLVSGGDPLTYSDDRLDELLQALRSIAHVEIIRVATRNPVTLPQRITSELSARLKKHHPIFVNTHFNHLQECTPEAAQALTLLADAGCVLGNQMVLLKGINEDPEMVKKMNQWLLKNRVRPYYIFQCDAAQGISHFRTPIETGINLIENLRGHTSGLAVPHYVVDLTGGGGKVPLVPTYLQNREGRKLTFRNFKGDLYEYEEGT
jgi:lysine 2,3-aminomutase